MAEIETHKKRQKRVRPFIPASMCSAFSIPEAVNRIPGSSESQIRKLITKGRLSEKRGEIINWGTGEQAHWIITKKGWKVLTEEDISGFDIVTYTAQVIKMVKEGNL